MEERLKLKKQTNYRLSKEDKLFAMELAKIGSVHFLSSQVSLISEKDKGFSFVEYGEKSCKGLTLPENWVIEGIYNTNGFTKITFGVEN